MFSNVNVVKPSRNSIADEHLYENPIGALGGSPTTYKSVLRVGSSSSTDVNDQYPLAIGKRNLSVN